MVVTNVLSYLISLNLFDAKVHAAPINALARDTCSSENLKSESDVASKLDLISPGLFSKGSYGIKNGMTNLNTFGTPEHAIPNAAELSVFKTAPIMQPMHKIKSRLPNLVAEEQGLPLLSTYPSGVKNFRSIPFTSSPVSRINFSPSANVKVPQKVLTVPNNHAGSKINSVGCKLVPIEVLDATPKPELARASPDVLITGASSFNIRQAELARKGDELYNNMSTIVSKQEKGQSVGNLDDRKSDQDYIDLSQNAVEERFPKDELVILQPKNSLVLPLIQNGRFPVTSADVKHYCAIVDIAYTKGIQKLYAVKYMKVHCSYISLGQSLMVEGHVDNFLIPVFCRKLFEDNHPSKSGRHHFFSFVGESILAYESDVHFAFVEKALLGAATASKGKRLELSDRLFFPICRIRHWFTFCVDFKYKVFIFLDSLYSKDDVFHTSIKKRLINNFVKLWKTIFKTDVNIFKTFGVMYANVPKQDNADDCGIFTMKFMEIYKPELDMRRFFSKDDIVNIRIQYANKLFFCERNNADKSLVLDFCS